MVALSGGADSAVLAWAARAEGAPVRAVHIHHGQAASDRLAAAAARIARQVGVALETRRVTVPSGSFEASARRVRYATLLGCLHDEEVLAVGHTRDDQAETVLLRLARGAGPSGVAAMRPEIGRIVRPLLEFSRAQIRTLADELALGYVDDPANQDERHARVVVRSRVLPELEEVQPGAGRALAGHAARAAELDDHLEGEIDRWVRPGVVAVAVYRTFPPFMQRRMLRRMVALLSGLPPDAAAVDRMHAVAAGEARSAQIGDGWEIGRRGALLVVARTCAAPPSYQPVPDQVEWPGWLLRVQSHPGRPPAWPLDHDRAAFPLEGSLSVRPLQASDRIGSRPIADHVPGSAAERKVWPVVEHDGKPAWVPGVTRLDAGWLTDRTDGYRWMTADRRDAWTSDRS